MLLENLQAFSGQVSGAPQLSLFLQLDSNTEEVAEIESRLKQHPQVASFEFIPRKRPREFKQSTGLADVVESLEQNPLPGRLRG